MKRGCKGHILLTQDCINAFVRTVELRDLRALSEELKSAILFISKLSGRATPLQSENLILVWGKKKTSVAHCVQIYLSCTQIQLYKHRRLHAYLG